MEVEVDNVRHKLPPSIVLLDETKDGFVIVRISCDDLFEFFKAMGLPLTGSVQGRLKKRLLLHIGDRTEYIRFSGSAKGRSQDWFLENLQVPRLQLSHVDDTLRGYLQPQTQSVSFHVSEERKQSAERVILLPVAPSALPKVLIFPPANALETPHTPRVYVRASVEESAPPLMMCINGQEVHWSFVVPLKSFPEASKQQLLWLAHFYHRLTGVRGGPCTGAVLHDQHPAAFNPPSTHTTRPLGLSTSLDMCSRWYLVNGGVQFTWSRKAWAASAAKCKKPLPQGLVQLRFDILGTDAGVWLQGGLSLGSHSSQARDWIGQLAPSLDLMDAAAFADLYSPQEQEDTTVACLCLATPHSRSRDTGSSSAFAVENFLVVEAESASAKQGPDAPGLQAEGCPGEAGEYGKGADEQVATGCEYPSVFPLVEDALTVSAGTLAPGK